MSDKREPIVATITAVGFGRQPKRKGQDGEQPGRLGPADRLPQHLSAIAVKRLLTKRLIASLATLDRKGRIHVVPMWFRAMDESLLFPTSSRSRKVSNLRHSTGATAMIHEARGGPDVRGVMVYGRIEVLSGEQARRLNHSIHIRYMTSNALKQPAVADMLDGDDVTLRLWIEDMVTWKIKAGPRPDPGWSRPLA